MRLCMEAVMPKGADRPLALKMPRVRCADDAEAAFDLVLDAFERGVLSAREFTHMLGGVGRMARLAEQIQQLHEREAARGGARRTWELHPSMLPKGGPDPLEGVLRAAGGGTPVYSPADFRPATGGAEGEGLYSPVISRAGARHEGGIAPFVEEVEDGYAVDRTDGEGQYFPVNSGGEPPPGAADAAPPSPASGGGISGELQGDAAVDDEFET
jgi:hypothetical protein